MKVKLQFLFLLLMSFHGLINAQITCPTDISQSTDANVCGAIIDYNFGVDTSNYNVTIIEGLESGSLFPVGTTQNTIVLEDFIGSMDTCSFSVTITDMTPPVFNCNENIVVNTEYNSCDAVVQYTMPTVNDNCNTEVNVIKHNNSDVISGGSPYSCEGFLVSHMRVFDLAAMGVTGDYIISNIEVGVGYSNENQEATMKIYTLNGDLLYENMTLLKEVTTNIPNLINELYQFPISTTVSSTSTLVVEYIPSDNRLVGYNTSGGQTAPSYVASLGPDCLVTEPTDLETLGETGFSLIMKVNGGNFTMSQTAGLPSGSTFPLGTTTNTFLATDASGNSSTCSFDVIVQDNQVPIIECPGLMTVINDESGCTAVVEYDIIVYENCPDYTLTQLAGLPSGASFPNGTTLNTYMVSDVAGNTDTCSFEIVVTDGNIPFFTSCPDNIVVDADPDLCGAVVNYTIDASDDCSLPVTVSLVKGLASGLVFPIGTTIVAYQATDNSGNTEICEFNVTVNGSGNSSPTFETCPENIVVNVESDCGMIVDYDLPTIGGSCNSFAATLKQNLVDTVEFAWADCGTNGSKHLRVFDLPSMGINGQFDVNMVSVGIGYVATATDITINLYTLDGELQYANMTSVGTMVQNITPSLNNEIISIPVTAIIPANSVLVAEFVVPSHADAAHIVGYNNGPQSADSYYAAADCGIIEPYALSSVGRNQSLILEVSGEYGLTASFNQIGGLASGSSFPVGITTNVFAMANDTCTFTVEVVDSMIPTIDPCENMMVNLSEHSCTATIELPQPETGDNCGIASVTNDHSDGNFEVGTTTVTWTVTDNSGNTNTCSFDVIVSDTIPPNIKCSDLSFEIAGSACDTTFVLTTPDITDNCEIDTIYNNLQTNVFPLGETMVEWTTVDKNGNSSTCTSKVTITSNFAPNVDNAVVQNIDCNGNENGMIVLNLNDSNIGIEWSNGATTDTITGLSAGIYEVSLTVSACSDAQSTYAFEIAEPTAITQDSVVIVNETNGLGNGSITLYVSGGTAPYSFINQTNLSAGEYSIEVTDANGCTETFGPFTVDNIVGNEDLSVFENISILPNPADDYTVISYHLAKADASKVIIYNVTGKVVWKSDFSSSSNNSIRLETNSWTKGLYFIHLQSGTSNTVQKLIIE